MKIVLQLREDIHHQDKYPEQDTKRDDRFWIEGDRVPILCIEVPNQSGTRHQTASVLASIHAELISGETS